MSNIFDSLIQLGSQKIAGDNEVKKIKAQQAQDYSLNDRGVMLGASSGNSWMMWAGLALVAVIGLVLVIRK